MTGKVGNGVFSIEQGGTGIRQYNGVSKQPFSEAQRAREAAFTKANQTWPTIGRANADKWRVWGAKQKVKTISGGIRGREGKDCFVGYFAKMLQVNAAAAVPLPPVGTFGGDGATFSLLLENPTMDWVASKANATGVTTELMVQELPSEVALPNPQGYKTLAFHAFASGSLSYTVELDPGFYAFAAQEVEIATGRTACFAEVGFGTFGLALVRGGTDEEGQADEASLKAA